MKLFLSFFTLFLLTYTGYGQKQNSNWAFGSNISSGGFGITFNTNPPSVFQAAIHGNNSMFPTAVSDSAGNLLFYTNGNIVWTRNHNVMPNGMDISLFPNAQQGSIYQPVTSTVIIPDPGNVNRYYIVSTPAVQVLIFGFYPYRSFCKYSIVDMSLNGGNGDVLVNYKNKFLDTNRISGVLAATGNGICNKWVILKKDHSNQFLAYQVTAGGINPTPVVSQATDWLPTQLKFSNDNNWLGSIEHPQYPDSISQGTMTDGTYVRLYRFNTNTGVISNGITVDSTFNPGVQIRGMEFSGDNSKFYYCNDTNNSGAMDTVNTMTYRLRQVDLSIPTPNAIKNSRTLICSFDAISKHTALNTFDPLLAPDNKIYLGLDFNNYILIQHPNLPGQACAPVYKVFPGIPLGNTSLVYSYHNAVPVSKLYYSHDDIASCSFPAQLKSRQPGADSYQWNTGATTQAITINQNGTYWVKALQSCGAYRIDTFHVNLQPLQPPADTFSCNGTPVTIPMNPRFDYVWNDSLQGNVITKTGQYVVTISNGQCGSIKDTFNVKIYPPLGTPVLPSDTTFCDGLAQHTLSCIYDLEDYKWSTGATSRTVTIDTPGIYWLESNTPCGIFRDTIQVNYCAPVIDSILSPDIVCAGSCIAFKPVVHNYPDQYSWTFTGAKPDKYTGAEPSLICYDSVGNYSIELTAFNKGGSSFYKKQITVLPKPVPRFKDSLIAISYKAPLLLPSCADAARVDWYKEGKLICYDCPYIQADSKYWQSNYQCIVTNGDCSDSCTYKVQVTDIPSDAWLPTAFTPNGDNVNDHFRLVTDNPNIYVIELSVYNRFGQRLYIGQRNDGGWDGTFNGLAMDMGTYFWHLRYKVIGSNDVQEQKGDVMLIR